jgi:hypothetical protein
MKEIAGKLIETVNNTALVLKSMTEDEWAKSSGPGKWSKKEILGHLVDSAFNNHRRFVEGQIRTCPNIFYDQEAWVLVQNYRVIPGPILAQFWWMMNIHIAHILEMMPTSGEARLVNTGHDKEELHTLRWLAEDYLRHLNHHLRQIIS